MHTNLYLVEQLDRQRRQYFIDQAARDYVAVQMSNMTTTRSQTMKRIKLIVAAALVTATLLGAGSQAIVAQQDSGTVVASLCCWVRR
jgi:hypothetical protein